MYLASLGLVGLVTACSFLTCSRVDPGHFTLHGSNVWLRSSGRGSWCITVALRSPGPLLHGCDICKLSFVLLTRLRTDAKKIKNGRNYESVFKDLIIQIKAVWTIYRMSCERLLRPITPHVISEKDCQDLLDQPGPSKWQDPNLLRGLKLVLLHSFEAYQAYTVLLHEKLEKLRSKLGLNPQYLVCYQ